MQSFYASCEAASRPEYALARTEHEDASDPSLVVAGDPESRSGIILAATPPAKKSGITTAMALGEALQACPDVIVVRPRMKLYMDTSVRIQETIQRIFPVQEQFSVDEAFFAFPYPTILFQDPMAASEELKRIIWDLFRIRCRIGLGENKWMAKMANKQAKKSPNGIVWLREEDIETKLHPLPVFDMWGLKRRAEVLYNELGARTIGDVARLTESQLQRKFGVWGTVIHRWSRGQDISPMNPDAYDAPHKGFSHRTTLPRDFYRRDEVAVVMLELLDEVCRRVRAAGQEGRRIGLGLTYRSFEGGFYRARALDYYSNQTDELYPDLLRLLDQWWSGEGVRAIAVSLDLLRESGPLQLSLFEDVARRQDLSKALDEIRGRFGETSIMRAVSLKESGQLQTRSRKIGGHFM
jgi:nucleotidyltransferase/DNA polymerase involved in DNA repair